MGFQAKFFDVFADFFSSDLHCTCRIKQINQTNSCRASQRTDTAHLCLPAYLQAGHVVGSFSLSLLELAECPLFHHSSSFSGHTACTHVMFNCGQHYNRMLCYQYQFAGRFYFYAAHSFLPCSCFTVDGVCVSLFCSHSLKRARPSAEGASS